MDGDKARVIRALKVISAHRKGDYTLESYAANMGSGGEQTLSVSDAYKRLQIAERNVPDETVLTRHQLGQKTATPRLCEPSRLTGQAHSC